MSIVEPGAPGRQRGGATQRSSCAPSVEDGAQAPSSRAHEGTGRPRRCRRQGGASLVEYALGFSLLIVAGLVAFNFLTDAAGDQAEQQATCIAQRPPPPSCVRTPVPAPPSPSSTGSVGTTTTLGPAPTSPPPSTAPTTAPPRSTVTAQTATVARNDASSWRVSAPVTIRDQAGNPVAGAVVTARAVLGRQPFLVECTTTPAGTCALVLNPIPQAEGGVVLSITSVAAEPPAAGGPYPEWRINRPT